MSQIKLLHSGGNGVIIAAPDSNPASDRTLKLPGDGDGTILTTNSSVGKILQVKQTVKTDVSSRGGSSGSDSFAAISGLSVDITPSATSSKILVMVNIKQGEESNAWARYQLQRDSTAIYLGDTASGKTPCSNFTYVSSNYRMTNVSEVFLDTTHNSTSQLTYQVYWGARGGSGTIAYINRTGNDSGDYAARTASSITAMEIAA